MVAAALGSDGLVAYLVGGEAEDGFAAEGAENLSQLGSDVGAGHHKNFVVEVVLMGARSFFARDLLGAENSGFWCAVDSDCMCTKDSIFFLRSGLAQFHL
jgi:hypothetical protein